MEENITKQVDLSLLLRKYISYIQECEGTDYIQMHDQRGLTDVTFSDDEWKYLTLLSIQENGNK